MPLHDWTRVDANDYHHFHGRWIYSLADALNEGRLPADVFAMAEHQAPPFVPDVLTLKGGDTDPPANGSPSAHAVGGVAVLTTPPKVRIAETASERSEKVPKERRVVVRHARNRRLVAVIEIVSPSNKASREETTTFVNKTVSLLRQGVHLLVIDPFPPTKAAPDGMHAAIWKALVRKGYARPADKPLTLSAYVARGGRSYGAYVEPVAVGDVLPDMPLFLDAERYVNVPLELTYRTAWAAFPAQLRGLVEPTPGGKNP